MSISAEEKLSKLTEEQIAHLNALKEKLEQIDALSSNSILT
jgi:hypothetical protein